MKASRSKSPYVLAKQTKKPESQRSKSPIRSQIEEAGSSLVDKYPLYSMLKMASLGLRPKRMSIKDTLICIEETYSKIQHMSTASY